MIPKDSLHGSHKRLAARRAEGVLGPLHNARRDREMND